MLRWLKRIFFPIQPPKRVRGEPVTCRPALGDLVRATARIRRERYRTYLSNDEINKAISDIAERVEREKSLGNKEKMIDAIADVLTIAEEKYRSENWDEISWLKNDLLKKKWESELSAERSTLKLAPIEISTKDSYRLPKKSSDE